jgi:adenosine deaminase
MLYPLLFLLLIPIFGFSIDSQFKNLEKSELHLHIGGSWPIGYLETIAEPQQFSKLNQLLDQIQNGEVDYHQTFAVFHLIYQLMNSDERIENGTAALCENLWQDRVTYAEFRTGLKNLGSGLEGYLQSVLRGIERGTEGKSFQVNLILSLRRDTPYDVAEQTINLAIQYRNQGVVGIDVSGDSIQGDGKHLFDLLLKAKANHLPITLHIGESRKETPEQQMLELRSIQPQRIGHGVHLCDEAKQWVVDNQILVEMCPTSAVKTDMIREVKDHPALQLLLQGHPVAICTDDPLLFRTTLSEEYALVAEATALSPDEIHSTQKRIENYFFRP